MNKRFEVQGPHHRRDRTYYTVFDKQTKQVIAMPERKNEAWSLAGELEEQYWKEVRDGRS